MTTTPYAVDGVTEINSAIQNSTAAHAIQDYASAALRTASSHTAFEGQVTARTDVDRLELYDGTTWQRGPHYGSAGRTTARVRRAAVQAVATATTTTISGDTEDQDVDGIHAAPTYTVPAGLGGLYLADLKVTWASDPGTSTFLGIIWTISGVTWYTTTELGSAARPGAASAWYTGLQGSEYLSAGDTVSFVARQSSGASINITARMHLTRLGV